VPCSSPKFLQKSLTDALSTSDTIIYDLEDSVPNSGKEQARTDLVDFLKVSELRRHPSRRLPAPTSLFTSCSFDQANPRLKTRLAVRINAVGSGYEEDDIAALFSLYPFTTAPAAFAPSSPLAVDDKTSPPPLPVIVIPKVDHPGHLSQVARLIKAGRGRDGGKSRVLGGIRPEQGS
jgi:hypothetical protein